MTVRQNFSFRGGGRTCNQRARRKTIPHDGIGRHDATFAKVHARADMDPAADPAIGPDRDPRDVKALTANACLRFEEMILIPDRNIFPNRNIIADNHMLTGNDMRARIQGDMISNLNMRRASRLEKDIVTNHAILTNDDIPARYGKANATCKHRAFADLAKEKRTGQANKGPFECPDGGDH